MRQSIHEDGPSLSRQHSTSPENGRVRSSSKNSGSLSPASSISLVSLKLSTLSTNSSSAPSSSPSSSGGAAGIGNCRASSVAAVNTRSNHFTSSSSKTSILTGKPAAASTTSILHQRQQRTGSLKSLLSSTSSSTSSKRADNKNCLMSLDDFDIIKTIGTGTFGQVRLCRNIKTGEYGALKILQMCDVIRLKQVDHVKNEKNILQQVNHPFIVNLKSYTRDEFNLYMLFEYVCGGELFSYLRNAGHFSTPTSSFYAAEIICALEYLHARSIVYRDLKPENLLLDKEGHLKITDFGFAKQLKDRTWTLCGTPEYLAPEVIQSKGHNKAVDWWALGVLIYEMLCGFPPFSDDNNFSTYEKILSGKIDWPKNFEPVAKDLVKKLLTNDRTKRLGCMKNGVEDVKRHRWFREYDWDDVKNRRLNPPIIPKVSFEGDTRNFDEYPEEESFRVNAVTKAQLELFADF